MKSILADVSGNKEVRDFLRAVSASQLVCMEEDGNRDVKLLIGIIRNQQSKKPREAFMEVIESAVISAMVAYLNAKHRIATDEPAQNDTHMVAWIEEVARAHREHR